MKDTVLHCGDLRVAVNAFGAELKSLELGGFEYLWQGDPATYPRTSPTLFPIVGRFLSDTHYVGDQAYPMPLNGFALDRNFTLCDLAPDAASFRLTADERTRAQYPYDFELTVSYHAEPTALTVSQTVYNPGDVPLPFCLGCHTAYRWPLTPGDRSTDCFLRFEKPESLESFNPFGWRQSFVNGDTRPLSHELFANFTRSVTNLRSDWVELASHTSDRRVRIYRAQYPYIAMWTTASEDAAFLCIEPCTSIHTGDHGCMRLEDREGAIVLPAGETLTRSFRIELF